MSLLARVPLHREGLSVLDRPVIESGELSAALFRYDSGVEAIRLRNGRGEIVVLPWMGQMVWNARFDGVDLAMRSGFAEPLPADTIAGTYGCLAFHSGLLRNGVPAPGDDHAAHGEFPCARMRRAWIELVEEEGLRALRLVSEREHVVGFGPHYLAHPAITLPAGEGRFSMELEVRNRSGSPMELMYMAHVNFAFVADGRIVQPAPFDAAHVAVRRAVPAHVRPDPAYLATIDAFAADPAPSETLRATGTYDPEQVFYLHGLGTDGSDRTALMLRRPGGDAFALDYAPAAFGHLVRWILEGPDQGVAGFALPSTCEPEGYGAEKRKGNVRLLPPGGSARFSVRLGHLNAAEADREAARIAAMTSSPLPGTLPS
ncbi:DUF4432 family protein [Rhizosaccharibacter radicis]|uniref:DUF4432 family protein n=1 Tax=Rhizosaccharibacter radicis TaxID=2782605 RepID=A0ABT1W2J0_9PROT|nr:DUF4432 family protein [Acetobacteraceae bacterium KSS12]